MKTRKQKPKSRKPAAKPKPKPKPKPPVARPPAPPPPVQPAPPPASWHLPGPVMFTASDPNAALGHSGIGTTLVQLDSLTWQSRDGSGLVVQAESEAQYSVALERIQSDRRPHMAVVTVLGIDPAKAIRLGVNVCFVECYLPNGVDGQANALDKYSQAFRDGWPYVWPICGVYDACSLEPYVHWLRENGFLMNNMWGVYLAEGMGDTGSWPTFEQIT